jgi:hypothetical protein
MEGIFDPPSALSTATGLVPETTPASSPTQTIQTAAPASSPTAQPLATATLTNAVPSGSASDPTATTITFGDPSTQTNSVAITTTENNDLSTTVVNPTDPTPSTAIDPTTTTITFGDSSIQASIVAPIASNGLPTTIVNSPNDPTTAAKSNLPQEPSQNAQQTASNGVSAANGQPQNTAQEIGSTQAAGATQTAIQSPQSGAVLTLSNGGSVTAVQISVSNGDPNGNVNGNGASVVADQNEPPGSSAVVIVAGQTLSQGGPAAIISGETISLGSSGIIVQQSGGKASTIPISSLSGSTPQSSSVSGAMFATVSLGSGVGLVTATAIPARGTTPAEIEIGSMTLTVGGQATTSNGMVFSAASNGLVVVPASTVSGMGAILTVGNSVLTAFESLPSGSASGIVVVGSVTLTIGGAAKTLNNGVIVSAGSSGLIAISTSHGILVTSTLSYSSLSGSKNSTVATTSRSSSSISTNTVSTTDQSISFIMVPSNTLSSSATGRKKSGAVAQRVGERDWLAISKVYVGGLTVLVICII